MAVELELKASANALAGFRPLWDQWDLHLGINVSPQTVFDPRLETALAGYPAERIMVEITEHDVVEDYEKLGEALAPLRARGMKVAVDDAGSGYASLRHILKLKPDVIKLDVSLTRDIDGDPMRFALAAAIVEFARQVGCVIIAEGIETEAEKAVLIRLGVHQGQGFLLARPGSLDALAARLGA
jgi:EAL domain-containing protein (putative c-di-GMP-specific phosphodiesterase class I)